MAEGNIEERPSAAVRAAAVQQISQDVVGLDRCAALDVSQHRTRHPDTARRSAFPSDASSTLSAHCREHDPELPARPRDERGDLQLDLLFSSDSPLEGLEGDGFEPSVPRQKDNSFSGCSDHAIVKPGKFAVAEPVIEIVAPSFKWYQSLLGLPETAPAHSDFGQIVDSDGTVFLCLHEWGAHEHPSLTSPHYAKPGNGLLLFFRVDNFDIALPRARALVSRLEEEPHVNPSTGTAEFSLRDPDGYYVTVSALNAA
jgi:hypothetical protein